MRRTTLIPAVLAAAALAAPVSAPAARPSKLAYASSTHGKIAKAPTPGSLEWQRAWSDAWHNANPGKLLPGPHPLGSVAYARQWEQAVSVRLPAR